LVCHSLQVDGTLPLLLYGCRVRGLEAAAAFAPGIVHRSRHVHITVLAKFSDDSFL
jgi:hypothetical protein